MRRMRLFAIACLASVCSAATIEGRRALYDEALAIIRREFAADLRLTEVARRIGASGRVLQRAFAEHGELSFSEELRTTRLNVAARLLRGTELPVSAVARRVGYGDHAGFTKAFRRQHGMSPRAYAARGRSSGGQGQGNGVSLHSAETPMSKPNGRTGEARAVCAFVGGVDTGTAGSRCPDVWGEAGAMNVLVACVHGKRGRATTVT